MALQSTDVNGGVRTKMWKEILSWYLPRISASWFQIMDGQKKCEECIAKYLLNVLPVDGTVSFGSIVNLSARRFGV